MKKLLQVLLLLFIPLKAFGERTGEEFQVSTNCLYSGNGKNFRNIKCDIERLEVGGHYFSDRLIMNKASFIVSAGNITPSFSGEEYATFSGEGIPKEEVNYFWLNEQLQKTASDESWLCFQRKHNQETFCEPTLEKMFNLSVPKGKSTNDVSKVYESGTYKVGVDIPAGEYKVIANSSDKTGTLFVSKSANYRNSIIHSEIFTNQTYVTVKEGEYLRVNFGKFSLVE